MSASAAKARHPDRRIWAIAGPAILSNVTAATIGLVDSWAVGHLPDPEALAGLALGAFAMSTLVWSLSFLRMGTTGLVAQAYGRKRLRAMSEIALRAAVLGFALGLVLIAGKSLFAPLVLDLIGADGDGRSAGRTYLDIRLWAAPFFLVKIAVVGTLIGLQRTDLAFYLEAGVNALNAALTVLFVTVLEFGIAGAAWGSLLAESAAGLVAGGVLLLALRPGLAKAMLLRSAFWDAAAYVRLLKVNGWLFARTLVLIASFGLYVSVAEDLGPATLAACHIVLNFYILQALTLDALAYAAEALVGEAIGAGARRDMRRWVRRTNGWAFALSLLYLGLFAAFGRDLFHVFTDQDAVRAAAEPLYFWIAVTPVIAVWCYQYDGIFIGAARPLPMFWTMALSLIAFQLLIWALVPRYGAAGLCAAFLGFFGLRGVSLAMAYLPMERKVIPA